MWKGSKRHVVRDKEGGGEGVGRAPDFSKVLSCICICIYIYIYIYVMHDSRAHVRVPNMAQIIANRVGPHVNLYCHGNMFVAEYICNIKSIWPYPLISISKSI